MSENWLKKRPGKIYYLKIVALKYKILCLNLHPKLCAYNLIFKRRRIDETIVLRYILMCVILAVTTLSSAEGLTPGVLKPVGQAVGVNPGRVVWTHAPGRFRAPRGASDWSANAYVPTAVIDTMIRNGLNGLADTDTDAQAWDLIFRDYNRRHRKLETPYRNGEKIAVVIDNRYSQWHYNSVQANTTPQVVVSVVESLIRSGVNPQDITIVEPTGWLPDGIYATLRRRYRLIGMIDATGTGGRNKVRYRRGPGHKCQMEKATAEAEYIINIPILRASALPSANLVRTIQGGVHAPFEDLEGRCLLTVVDLIYTSLEDNTKPAIFWQSEPFNNRWPSSLLISQDPVAADAVATDLLGTQGVHIEGADTRMGLAASCGFGTAEHWRTNHDPLYSRNLGRPGGIELIYTSL